MRLLPILALIAALASGAHAAPLAQSFQAVRNVVVSPDGKSFQTKALQNRDALERLLEDADASVRVAALKALKNYVTQTSRTRDRVLAVYERDLDKAVRYQAAKTLSFVAGYSRVENSLFNTARYGSDPALRAISVKALYAQAGGSSRVKGRILDLARYESDATVRAAAIWALFTASGDSQVRSFLLDTALREADVSLRIEALKSLYAGMGHGAVRDRVMRLAADGSESAAVREPAILLLSAVTTASTRDALQSIAKYEPDASLRAAAILAMDPANESLQEYFHLLRRTQQGGVIDPLDRE